MVTSDTGHGNPSPTDPHMPDTVASMRTAAGMDHAMMPDHSLTDTEARSRPGTEMTGPDNTPTGTGSDAGFRMMGANMRDNRAGTGLVDTSATSTGMSGTGASTGTGFIGTGHGTGTMDAGIIGTGPSTRRGGDLRGTGSYESRSHVSLSSVHDGRSLGESDVMGSTTSHPAGRDTGHIERDTAAMGAADVGAAGHVHRSSKHDVKKDDMERRKELERQERAHDTAVAKEEKYQEKQLSTEEKGHEKLYEKQLDNREKVHEKNQREEESKGQKEVAAVGPDAGPAVFGAREHENYEKRHLGEGRRDSVDSKGSRKPSFIQRILHPRRGSGGSEHPHPMHDDHRHDVAPAGIGRAGLTGLVAADATDGQAYLAHPGGYHPNYNHDS